MTLAEFEIALEQDIFDSLIVEHGWNGMAKLINKLISYKVYDSKYPRDKWAPIGSLDAMLNAGMEVQDEKSIPDQDYAASERVAIWKASLTEAQAFIMLKLSEGYSQSEIAIMRGDKDTGIVRYQKYLAKKKWND